MQQALPTADAVADEVLARITAAGAVTDELLAALYCLFDKHLAKALQIVDQGGVFCFVGERSGRRAIQVHGQSGEAYAVCPAHYCSCQAFFFDVVSRAEAPACKHQLAARLAAALGKQRTSTVREEVLAEVLQQH